MWSVSGGNRLVLQNKAGCPKSPAEKAEATTSGALGLFSGPYLGMLPMIMCFGDNSHNPFLLF
jgi:hypothetical protein